VCDLFLLITYLCYCCRCPVARRWPAPRPTIESFQLTCIPNITITDHFCFCCRCPVARRWPALRPRRSSGTPPSRTLRARTSPDASSPASTIRPSKSSPDNPTNPGRRSSGTPPSRILRARTSPDGLSPASTIRPSKSSSVTLRIGKGDRVGCLLPGSYAPGPVRTVCCRRPRFGRLSLHP